MKKLIIWGCVGLLCACSDGHQQQAEALLRQANDQFEAGRYDRALMTIDSLRRVYPNAIETRKKALALYQDVELKRSQEELAVVDSALQAVKHDYETRKAAVDEARKALSATEDELHALNLTRARRDSLQTRFDVLCAKIRYIHKKQKE